ncbi:MAG: hypothetical protein Q8K04_08105 [Lutibacter sp.]|nr:hypothetical protein [Lutibacter sp.]
MKNIERSRVVIASMGKSEKRSFKIYCSTQSGEKAYLQLFDIIDNLPNGRFEKLENEFLDISRNKNVEIAAGYLYNQLLDFLVHKRSKKDMQSQIFMMIEKANILFERKLIDEAFHTLNQADNYASLFNAENLQIIIAKTEMYFLGTLGFPNLSEKQLIGKQVKLQELMKYSRIINQSYFLSDILNYRILHKSMASAKEKREELNDLVLSELNLISNNPTSNKQIEKFHLLFQSTYYLETGNYASAIRNYKQLILLFGENPKIKQNPPIYYLNAIEGILESLITSGIYNEMLHFQQKLRLLNKKDYPEDFLLKVIWLDYYYQIIVIIHKGDFEKTIAIQDGFRESLLKKVTLLPLDKQLQFHLINTILLFSQYKFAEAHKMIKIILLEGKIFQPLPLFRVVRLINLMIKAELGDMDYVENESIALKRNLTSGRLSKTEKIVFKFVGSYPLPQYQKSREKIWNYYTKKIKAIREENYEKRYLKYFDFLSFIESRLTNIPLNELLKKNHNQK